MLGPTIFQRPYWLDAVAPNQWHVVEVRRGSEVQAMMPYILRSGPSGTRMITMPPLTQTLGPWLVPHEAKYVMQLSRQHEVMTELIENLPPFDLFRQRFHYSVTNWLPFYWKGFQQTTRYTYVIEDLSDLDAVWRETRENVKRNIRKASKQLTIRSDLSLDAFLALNEKTFRRQDLSLPYTRDLVTRIDHTCQEHNCRKILFAEDMHGRTHAAIYLVWDDNAAYYLMGGSDPELKNSGATSLLMWEAIKFAATVTRTFDFEGSMIKPVERFFRAFGARQKTYMELSKVNSLVMKIRQDVRLWLELWHAR